MLKQVKKNSKDETDDNMHVKYMNKKSIYKWKKHILFISYIDIDLCTRGL